MLDRRDYATAIPQLQNEIKVVQKKTASMDEEQTLYSVRITASYGNRISPYIPTTILTAKVYSWETDITNSIDDNYIVWTRDTGDDVSDAEWNVKHAGGERSITVGEEDLRTSDDEEELGTQAIFRCTVTHGGVSFAEEMIVIYNPEIVGLQGEISDLSDATSSLQDGIDNLSDSVDNRFTEVENSITTLDENKADASALDDYVTKPYLSTMIEQTNQGLFIKGQSPDGSQIYPISTRLTYDQWEFIEQTTQGERVVAYIASQNFHIKNGTILQNLIVGNHKITTDNDSFEIAYEAQ